MPDAAEEKPLVWECGPHTNAWGGHDARCRKVPAAERPVTEYRAPVTAQMRQGLTGDRSDLVIDRLSGQVDDVLIVMARVPGLGHATVRHSPNSGWEAWLIQPPGRFLDREIRWIGEVAEVELLPNVSGEDRLVVEFHHLPGVAMPGEVRA